MTGQRRGWGLLVGVNLAVAAGLVGTCQVVTDGYIQQRKRTTLLYEPNGFSRFVLKKNQTHYRGGKPHFEVGPHRMRGAAPVTPKPRAQRRLFAVGGSSVFDHLTRAPSWPVRLGADLAARGVPGAVGFNAGVPGYSSREVLAFYADRVRGYEPDIVLFYMGWNDAKYMMPFREAIDLDRYYAQRDWAARYRFLLGPWPQRNLLALERMVQDKLQGPGLSERAPVEVAPGLTDPDGWMRTAGMSFWRKNLETFIALVRLDGAIPVLAVQTTLVVPDLPDDLRKKKVRYDFVGQSHASLLALNEAMARVLHEVGAAHDVIVLDVRSTMNGRAELFSDHVHLRPEGSRVLAETLAAALAPRLTQTASAAAP